MAGRVKTYIDLVVNGAQAVREFGQVEAAVDDVDGAVEDFAEPQRLSRMDAGLGAVKGSLQAIAGPAVVGAVVAGIGAAVQETVDLAIEASTVSTALGVSVEEASRLNAAFGDVGIEANDLVDIALQIQGGLEDNTELADRLGVTIADLESPIDAVRVGIDNWDLLTATERATLFGEEGVRQISRMVAEGKTLDEIMAGVSDLRIISAADAERARRMAQSMAELKGLVEGVTIAVGTSMLEAFENVNYVAEKLPGNIDAAAVAVEAFTAGLSPALYALGKIDDAVNVIAGRFATKLGPDAEKVANAVLDAFEPVTDEIGDIGDEADSTGVDIENLGRTIGRTMTAAESAVNGFKSVINIDAQIADLTGALGEAKDGFNIFSAEGQAEMRDLSGSVLNLAEDLGVASADRVARIELAYSQGDIDALERELTELTRLRDVYVRIRQIGATGGSALPGLPFASSTSTTNITVNMSRTMGARDLQSTLDSWAQVNG